MVGVRVRRGQKRLRYRVGVRGEFSAAHRIEDYEGKCSNLHGHTYQVEVEVEGDNLDEINILLDLDQLRDRLNEVLSELDHKDLNTILGRNVTAEKICEYIYNNLRKHIDSPWVSLFRVRVYETPSMWAEVIVK